MTTGYVAPLARSAQLCVKLGPGLAAAAVIALAATYLSDHYKTPVLIFALLLGIALNALSEDAKYGPGIRVASRELLRVSVALLGLRITFSEILALGWSTVAMVVTAVGITIGAALLLARLLKIDLRFGLISGVAVGVCGASAAMAAAVAWPREDSEKDTVVVIAAITGLSTIAMVVYPALAAGMHLSPLQTGAFLGGSIHDVAQVVGAGFSVSQKAGEVATVVKLMRVAMLLPVVLIISLVFARNGQEKGSEDESSKRRPPVLPAFLVGFLALAAINSFSVAPKALTDVLSDASRWLLVGSVAALGMRTSARDLLQVGRKAIGLVVAETLVIGVFVLAWITLCSGF